MKLVRITIHAPDFDYVFNASPDREIKIFSKDRQVLIRDRVGNVVKEKRFDGLPYVSECEGEAE